MWKTFFKVLLIGAVFTPAPIIVSVHATFSSNDRQTLDAYPSNKSFAKPNEYDIQQLQKIEEQSADILKKIDNFVTLNQENSRKILELEAEKSRLNELVKRHREENEQFKKENIQNLQIIEKQTENLLKKINAFLLLNKKKSKTVQQLTNNNGHVQNAYTQEKKDYEQEQKTYELLQNDYNKIENEYKQLHDSYSEIKKNIEQEQNKYRSLQNDYNKTKDDYEQLQDNHTRLQQDHKQLQDDYDAMENDYKELQGVFEPLKKDSSKQQEYIKKIEKYCAKGILLETKDQIVIIKHNNDEKKIKKAVQTIKEKIQEFGKTIQERALSEIEKDLKDVLNKRVVKNNILKIIFEVDGSDNLFKKMFEEKSTAGPPPLKKITRSPRKIYSR